MDVTYHQADDANTLDALIRRERNAKQRDRYRVVQLAIQGQRTEAIMKMLGRSRGFVQRWAYAYRDDGLEAIAIKPQPGKPTILPADEHVAFKQRMLDGPTPADDVCTLRGVDAQRILQEEFGVSYSLNGVYDLLHRLNLSVLVPRPEHRKADPSARQKWVEDAPPLSSVSGKTILKNASPCGSRTKHASVSRGH